MTQWDAMILISLRKVPTVTALWLLMDLVVNKLIDLQDKLLDVQEGLEKHMREAAEPC